METPLYYTEITYVRYPNSPQYKRRIFPDFGCVEAVFFILPAAFPNFLGVYTSTKLAQGGTAFAQGAVSVVPPLVTSLSKTQI